MPGLELAPQTKSGKSSSSAQFLHDAAGAPIKFTAEEIKKVDKEIRQGVSAAIPKVLGSIVSKALETKRQLPSDEQLPQAAKKSKDEEKPKEQDDSKGMERTGPGV